MKRFILLTLMQVLIGITASADANAITQWEETIPVNPELALELINEQALNLTYQDEDTGKICGGETFNYQLADYFTFEDYDGLVTHHLVIKFQVTVPVDFCSAEVVRECQTKLSVTDEDDVRMGKWNCATDAI